MTDHDDTVLLDAADDVEPEHFDHPDVPTAAEEAEGHALWEAIDDLDDDSNGIDPPGLLAASSGKAEAMRRAKIIRQCLLDAGVPEVSIELQQGRPGGDRWNSCKPVMVMSHHIASKPTASKPTPGLALVKKGRSDLPGPLANGTAGVDLVYRILTLGMANHPGTGGPLTVRGPMGNYTIPKDVARPHAWGTEFEGGYTDAVWDRKYTNKRTGKTMTYREFMGRVNSGLTRAIWLINGKGKNPGSPGQHDLSGYHGEHKTWAPGRKPDRHNYSTESGRAEVRRYTPKAPAKPKPTPKPNTDQGDIDMASVADIWNYRLPTQDKPAKNIRAGSMLASAQNRAGLAVQAATAASTNALNALKAAQQAVALGKANAAAIKAIAAQMEPQQRAAVAEAVDAVDATAVDEVASVQPVDAASVDLSSVLTEDFEGGDEPDPDEQA